MKIIFLLSFLTCSSVQAEGFLSKIYSSISSEGGDPSFIKNQPIDTPFSELNKKYRNSFIQTECRETTVRGCAVNNLKCKCFKLPLMSMSGGWIEDLSATVADNQIKEYFHILMGNQQILQLKSPTPTDEFGDTAPTNIWEFEPSNGVQYFILIWKFKKGHAAARVFCPLKKFAGKVEVGPLRSCSMEFMKISRIDEYIKSPDAKISTIKY